MCVYIYIDHSNRAVEISIDSLVPCFCLFLGPVGWTNDAQ